MEQHSGYPLPKTECGESNMGAGKCRIDGTREGSRDLQARRADMTTKTGEVAGDDDSHSRRFSTAAFVTSDNINKSHHICYLFNTY